MPDGVLSCLPFETIKPSSFDFGHPLQVWQLRGRYPNRGYPKIFNDATVGVEAKKLFDEATEMLNDFVKNKKLSLKGIVGLYPANAVGEDVEVYTDETRSEVLCKYYGLRQQAETDDQQVYLSMTDFIAPAESGEKDYIGAFANACFGLEAITEDFKAKGDDYSYIMAEAIADRLAEAFAEVLHLHVRKDLWGYAPDENLSPDDLLKVKYQGIRPAPGYPSQPDHTEKETMWKMLQVQEKVGMTLTESMAMLPAAAVSGLYFGGKCSQYFAVGKITSEQVRDYAARKGMEINDAERWLAPMLNYEP